MKEGRFFFFLTSIQILLREILSYNALLYTYTHTHSQSHMEAAKYNAVWCDVHLAAALEYLGIHFLRSILPVWRLNERVQAKAVFSLTLWARGSSRSLPDLTTAGAFCAKMLMCPLCNTHSNHHEICFCLRMLNIILFTMLHVVMMVLLVMVVFVALSYG